MTVPTTDPAAPPLPSQVGQPPAAPPLSPAPAPAQPGPAAPDDAEELRSSLEKERSRSREMERQLAQLRDAQMTDQEKAVEAARAEGRKDAAKASGTILAGAEFRALAAGRLADAAKMIDDGDLNLARFVDDEGKVDKRALGRLVDRLAAAAAPPAGSGPGVPAGPRGTADNGDFLRGVMHGGPKGWAG